MYITLQATTMAMAASHHNDNGFAVTRHYLPPCVYVVVLNPAGGVVSTTGSYDAYDRSNPEYPIQLCIHLT